MKKLFILLAIFTTVAARAQSTGINDGGSAANASAMLDVSSTTKGFLPPRMTGAQRNAIASPIAAGLQIWCTDCGLYGETQVYDGTTWTNMIGSTAATITSRVTIGTQVWAVKNLDVATYSDGTVIPEVTDQTIWFGLTTGAWCYYNNDPANGAIYGKLYNSYAVAGIHDTDPNTPNKVLAPTGWHVPTEAEWQTLSTFLGGGSVAGGKMKATTFWVSPNTDATNSSGFTGLPGGTRYEESFSAIGANGFWWSSTINLIATLNSSASFQIYIPAFYPKRGRSVRCLRD